MGKNNKLVCEDLHRGIIRCVCCNAPLTEIEIEFRTKEYICFNCLDRKADNYADDHEFQCDTLDDIALS